MDNYVGNEGNNTSQPQQCSAWMPYPSPDSTSLNRTTYDTCAYVASLTQSVSPLQYMLDPVKYEHCTKCRPELGILGGTAVSHINGNLVDLENDLRGQTRPLTHCPEYKYAPPGGQVNPREVPTGKEYIKPVQHPTIDTTMQHLKPCQFSMYPRVPNIPFSAPPTCGQ